MKLLKNSKMMCPTDTMYVYYAQIYKMKHTVYDYLKNGGKKNVFVRIVTGMGQSSLYSKYPVSVFLVSILKEELYVSLFIHTCEGGGGCKKNKT